MANPGEVRAVDERDQLPRGQDAVRLDDELGDLVPVGGGVERETHRVAAPAQDVEGRARVPQRLELLARGAEVMTIAVMGSSHAELMSAAPATALPTGRARLVTSQLMTG